MRLRRPKVDLSRFPTWLTTQPGLELASTSVRTYMVEAEAFLAYAGRPGRNGWTKEQVERWIASRTNRKTGKPISAMTKNRALGVVKHLCAYAGVSDATDGVARSRVKARLPQPVEGLPFLLRRMEDDGRHDLKWTVIFLASTGLRVSEACQENGCGFTVVEDGDALRVHGKGSKDRYVPLDESAKAAMAMLTPPHGVFRVPMTVKQLQAATREYGFHPHQCRHLFGTTTYTRTRDIYVTSRLMGHASAATTQGYAAISTDVIREAMNGHPAGKATSQPVAVDSHKEGE